MRSVMKIRSEISGNRKIRTLLRNNIPFIASKLGAVEQNILLAKIGNQGFDWVRHQASNNAGITPATDDTLEFFVAKYSESILNSDMLGVWFGREKRIFGHLGYNKEYYRLRYLEPFYFAEPWSRELKNKNVLVIHPFEESIIRQYGNKKKIFNNRKILPDFNLLTIKAEQTHGGGLDGNKDFKESLDIMISKINIIDFDVAIIGCGAYGLILANHIKNMDKPAIHIGGGLQVLFGIKGSRWDKMPMISKMYNQYWVRPLPSERPKNYMEVEGSCYW